MEKIRKELVVSAIENGTVIDHVPASSVFKVIRILKLENVNNQILFGTNLDSEKLGKKGIVKIRDKYFEPEEVNKIALVAPNATLIIIKNFAVVEKKTVEVPNTVEKFVKCVNPNCISNHENIITQFTVIDKVKTKLQCHYCEKITEKKNMVFI